MKEVVLECLKFIYGVFATIVLGAVIYGIYKLFANYSEEILSFFSTVITISGAIILCFIAFVIICVIIQLFRPMDF